MIPLSAPRRKFLGRIVYHAWSDDAVCEKSYTPNRVKGSSPINDQDVTKDEHPPSPGELAKGRSG